MDFHAIPSYGEAVHILSTDDRGRIVTPLPVSCAALIKDVAAARVEEGGLSEAVQK